MDSPTRSEKMLVGDTRYSTPVNELDDHRNHEPIPAVSPEIVARRESIAHGHRGTAVSVAAPALSLPPNAYDGPVSRDFEDNAVDDDEMNEASRSPMESRSPGRRRSHRSINEQNEKTDPNEEAVSERSTSPPNSVDAFAEPRRRERANTFGSTLPSEYQRNRSVSGGTHRRRPTFNNGSVRDLPVDASHDPEDDVCFPQEQKPTTSFLIDYEEMEEYVANRHRTRNDGSPGRRHSYTSSGHQALMPKKSSSSEQPSDDLDEKLAAFEPVRKQGVVENQRFSFFSSELEQTIHVSDFADLVMPGETFRDLFELPEESGTWWLDIMNPTEDEIDLLQKAFNIHRLTAEDIEKHETREKVELFKQYYFVSFRSFVMDSQDKDFLDPIMVYMVVFRTGILTFSYGSTPHASHVRGRIGKLRDYINLTADWICYAMVDDIVDCFAPYIVAIERESDQIDDQVFVLRAEDSLPLLRSIGECRKKATALMRLLGGKGDVIKGFAKRCNEQYSVTPRSEIGLYLGDIQDHVVTMMSNLISFEKMLSRSHNNYLAQLSVDNLMQGNKANSVLSKITVVASILVPMNLVTGLFGMNVHVPGMDDHDDFYWFGGIVTFIGLSVIIFFTVAKRMKFI